jgi:hypothetical protein
MLSVMRSKRRGMHRRKHRLMYDYNLLLVCMLHLHLHILDYHSASKCSKCVV